MLYIRKLLILTIVFAAAFFASCGDDTVTPPPPDPGIQVIDSNIFNWRFIPVPIKNFFDFYPIDTNKIYYVGDERVFFYNGNSSVLIHNSSERATSISGVNENCVFFGGYVQKDNSPWLKKWNGNIAEDIKLPNDSDNSIMSIQAFSPNDVWICTIPGTIYHYFNNSITTYLLILNPYVIKFFEKENSQYFYCVVNNNNGSEHRIYRFNGNEWVLISTDINSDGYKYSLVENTIFRNRVNFIDFFNGTSWQKKTETPGFIPLDIAGVSRDSFLCCGYKDLVGRMYFYNGRKWLYQSALPYPEYEFYFAQVKLVFSNNTYFGFYVPTMDINHNYILIGNIMTAPPD